MTRSAFLVYLILVWSSLCNAELVFVSLPANRTVVEGEDANFTCSVTLNGNPDLVQWQLRGGEDNIDQRIQRISANIPGLQSVKLTEPHRSPIILNNVSRSLDGLLVSCHGEDQTGTIIEQPDPPAVLGVFYPPEYTASTDPTTILEGTDFSYSFQFTANPPPDSFTWTKNSQAINDGRVAVSVSGLTITGTVRDDSGVYQVTSSNAAGVGSVSFTLNVQYPPEYDTDLVQHSQLIVGAPFTLNCTPSAANPPVDTVSIEVDGSPVTSGDTVTVTDNVLTIPSVQRSHSGNYSCTATNTRGSAVIYQDLLVTSGGVPLIAQVAVRFVTSSSLEVVTRLTTNGGRDILRYYVVLNSVASVFSGGGNQSVLSATVSTGGPRHRGEEGEEWSVSVVVENELGNSSEVVVVLQGQPSSVSDTVTVADVSSAVIGLSVTVALVIVISVTIVIVSLVINIVLCHRQASYKVKAPSPKEGDYQIEDIKEVKLESNPAYEAVTTT